MKKLTYNLIKFGIPAILFALGFVFAKLINVPGLEISKSIDIINVISIIVTVGLAILITTFFDKRKNDNRVEKDLIIKRVDLVLDIVCELQKESISGTVAYTEAASSIKRINTSLKSIYRVVEKCQFEIKDDIKKQIKSTIKELRNTLTDTPKLTEDQIAGSDLPVEVKDGIIHYNRQKITQIEIKFDKVKDCLLELEIRINKK